MVVRLVDHGVRVVAYELLALPQWERTIVCGSVTYVLCILGDIRDGCGKEIPQFCS